MLLERFGLTRPKCSEFLCNNVPSMPTKKELKQSGGKHVKAPINISLLATIVNCDDAFRTGILTKS